jgi:hypothetical protein
MSRGLEQCPVNSILIMYTPVLRRKDGSRRKQQLQCLRCQDLDSYHANVLEPSWHRVASTDLWFEFQSWCNPLPCTDMGWKPRLEANFDAATV